MFLKNAPLKMKKLIYFSLLTFIVACGLKSQQSTHVDDTLAQYRDTLIGRFNGNDIDTLIAEPIDTIKERSMWNWRIFSKHNSVDTLILTQRFNVKMIQEGDLDGNGTDEFGVRRESAAGTWDNYYIYTFDNGEWKYLTEPIWTYSDHFYKDLSNGNNVAEKTDDCGLIRIRFSDVRNDSFWIIDTLIRINPHKINGFY